MASQLMKGAKEYASLSGPVLIVWRLRLYLRVHYGTAPSATCGRDLRSSASPNGVETSIKKMGL